jgi:hypothetical protein
VLRVLREPSKDERPKAAFQVCVCSLQSDSAAGRRRDRPVADRWRAGKLGGARWPWHTCEWRPGFALPRDRCHMTHLMIFALLLGSDLYRVCVNSRQDTCAQRPQAPCRGALKSRAHARAHADPVPGHAQGGDGAASRRTGCVAAIAADLPCLGNNGHRQWQEQGARYRAAPHTASSCCHPRVPLCLCLHAACQLTGSPCQVASAAHHISFAHSMASSPARLQAGRSPCGTRRRSSASPTPLR